MTVTIALADHVAERVRTRVETGQHEWVEAEKLAWMRGAWQRGIDSGPAGKLDVGALRREAHPRLSLDGGMLSNSRRAGHEGIVDAA